MTVHTVPFFSTLTVMQVPPSCEDGSLVPVS
jgi:hypothetical protein